MLRLVDIEFRQPQRREGRHRETKCTAAVAQPCFGIRRQGIVPQDEKHGRRGEAERDHVGQRVQLYADGGRAFEQPGHETVGIVENTGGDREPESQRQIAVNQCRNHRERAAKQARKGQQVGYGEQSYLHREYKNIIPAIGGKVTKYFYLCLT